MELSAAVRRRRMVRNFGPEPVDTAVLERILAMGCRGPSAGNTQVTDFVVLTGPTETARYWDATLPLERRARFAWPGLLRAPALIIPCVDPAAYVDRYGEPDKAATGLGAGADAWAVPYWHVDGGMAAMLVMLAAVDEGLGALFFGIFDHEAAVREALGIPPTVQPIGTIALGHPVPDEPGRSAGRPRRDADHVIHRGGW